MLILASYKLYADRDYLYKEYVQRRRTAKDIANEHGVTEMTVYNWLKTHDLLKFRGKGRNLGNRVIRKR